jgi:hypothetical protein
LLIAQDLPAQTALAFGVQVMVRGRDAEAAPDAYISLGNGAGSADLISATLSRLETLPPTLWEDRLAACERTATWSRDLDPTLVVPDANDPGRLFVVSANRHVYAVAREMPDPVATRLPIEVEWGSPPSPPALAVTGEADALQRLLDAARSRGQSWRGWLFDKAPTVRQGTGRDGP